MAEETKKSTTTTKKRTTTSKPKVEEPKPQLSIEEQMAQMMAMMMAQQQQLMELMQKTQQQNEPVNALAEEVVEKQKPKKQRKNNKRTKQDLRREYKDTDIYLINITQGIVTYKGKNVTYEWQNTGDVEIVSIDDIINMPRPFLYEPWLVLDSYENSETVIDDIKEVLNLEPVYAYIEILQDLHEDIESVDVHEVERAIELSRKRGFDITLDIVVLVQKKINSKELTNFHLIAELERILGRKFL